MEAELHDEPAVETETEIDHSMEDKTITHDSMVTVRLSETPLTINTNVGGAQEIQQESAATIEEVDEESPRITMMDPNGNEVTSPSGSESAESQDGGSRRGSDSSADSEQVNWEELEKTEEQEPRDQGSDDSTALLLARLEQENNLLATNPKSGIKVQTESRIRSKSRPPSMQHLKRLVNGPTPPALRYSMIPAPPMTDLEFYAALVQDYNRTAQCLPTLLSKKIRSGVPPPLRGVVWQSMSGARDSLLEDQFDRLCLESSPYEGIIGKDLGRSFPGVEMFRDPEGDGQRMLGRVLKCFSLYDHKIGYCQGLGFLVGPLLMHMGDKQAFCVLVRLMEHYDLRNCFLPDLSGLHVRIHQFRELLQQHLPTLSTHLDALQIEPAYVSQWFLSFFAVTCPLPMLFRIYDVIFAEGASETIMRVALSLMRKNEEKILACTEFEDVMQLLLSRGLWDCYHYNADDFVNDFVSLTGVVTHESLQALEASYKDSLHVDSLSVSETIGSTAQRFLGRLWAGPNSTKSANLSPSLIAPSRPVSFLRRSPSKQSIASTMNSIEGGSDSIMSASTDATSVSRDSSNTDGSSIRGQSLSFPVNVAKSNKDKNLHGQIEDLLTALSEMQRDHAILATQLQKEREEREEDRQAVRSLLDGLRKKTSCETVQSSDSEGSMETVTALEGDAEVISPDEPDTGHLSLPTEAPEQDLSHLLDLVEERFADPHPNRRSSLLQSKSQLRDELARSKEQLINEVSKSQDLSRRIADSEHEVHSLKEQLREAHTRIQNAHSEKQRLEKQVHELRSKERKGSVPSLLNEAKEEERPAGARGGNAQGSGLRELKLGRSGSQRSLKGPTFGKRTSSLAAASAMQDLLPPLQTPPSPTRDAADADALVLELVQAKTAEAVAKQEAEEAKAKLESLRRLLGMGTPTQTQMQMPGEGSSGPGLGHERSNTMQSLNFKELGGGGGGSGVKASVAAPMSAVTGGGFWGWGKK